jgi:hypothetical protein
MITSSLDEISHRRDRDISELTCFAGSSTVAPDKSPAVAL